MAEAKTDQEPSIEEILESIRQIISEDGEGAAKASPADKVVPLSLTPEAAAPQSEGKAVPLSLTPGAAQSQDKTVALSLTPEAAAPQSEGKALPLSLTPEAQAKDKAVALSLTPAAEGRADDNILDLTEKVTPEAKSEPILKPVEEPAIEMMDKPLTMDMPMTDDPSALISAQTADAATDALSKLLAGNFAVEKEDVPGRVGKVTLEDMTRELMKPLVKTWLDQNLPGLVEKLVQKEVEKLARRALER